MKIIQYGLLHIPTQELVKVKMWNTADGEFCNEVAYGLELNNKSKMIWLVDDAKKADFARQNGEKWYSSSYDFPECELDPKELAVVELVSEIKVLDLKQNLYEDIMVKKTVQEFQELGRAGQCQRVLDSYLKDKKVLSAKALKAKYQISSIDFDLTK